MVNKITSTRSFQEKVKPIFKYAFIILSFVGSIFSIYGVILTKLSNHFYSFFGVLCVMGFILGIAYLFNENQVETSEQIKILSEYYHEISHSIRDEFFKLEMSNFENSTCHEVKKNIENGLKNIIDLLSTGLTETCKCKVSACVKIFEFNKSVENNLDEMYITTLCRSSNSGAKRRRNDNRNIPVVGNTDFEFIMKGIEDYFAVTDLEKYQNEDCYENTNSNWIKFYKTTIVAPIRIEKELSNSGKNSSSEYNILGFLCVDAKSINAFKSPLGPFCLEFIKAFADITYIFLEKSKCYYLSCGEAE